ncbi:MAG: hypothetical protein IJ111_09270 [Eggerthellaceae bacterium]|nr:hypothetical protein [Eggerthellaceae bacterium]
MVKRARLIALTCLTALLALTLCACSNATASSDSAQQESEAAEEQTVSREDVEAILHKAAETTFTNVTFSMKTDTTATGAASNGQVQTQTMRTTTKGQLDKSGEKPKMHMSYEAQSSMQLGKTTYEMFIDSERLIVRQSEQLYVDAMTDSMLDSYAASVTSVMSADEIDAMLDMASGLKLQESDDETVVTITLDTDKLAEEQAVDDSSLPESTEISTMVVSYSVDPDDRIKTVRFMSSTTGTPTYRVNQTYEFSDYDSTALPEWPDLDAYVAQQSGIMTDENGRMYIIDDDGQIQYVSEIGEDGMIYFDTSGSSDTTSGETTTYYYDTPSQTGTTTTNASSTTGSSEEDKGRAYITADDGTIHFLDEEGSKLFENEDGTRYFIDADGNFYFLADEEE